MSSEAQTTVLKGRLEGIGYKLPEDELILICRGFDSLIQVKAPLNNDDLHMLVQEVLIQEETTAEGLITVKRTDYRREQDVLSATVVLSRNEVEFEATGSGSGPIASVWTAIMGAVFEKEILSGEVKLKDFKIFAEPGGVEAKGLSTICIENNGKMGYARGVDQDIILASAKAIVSAINHLLCVPVGSALV